MACEAATAFPTAFPSECLMSLVTLVRAPVKNKKLILQTGAYCAGCLSNMIPEGEPKAEADPWVMAASSKDLTAMTDDELADDLDEATASVPDGTSAAVNPQLVMWVLQLLLQFMSRQK